MKFPKKNKVVRGKTQIFVISPFCTPYFVLTLPFDWPVLYGDVAFLIIVLSTKKWCSSFLSRF